MQFGDLELISLSDGMFRLDGGSMFGVVPKLLWEKRAPADEKNRITLGLRPLERHNPMIVLGPRSSVYGLRSAVSAGPKTGDCRPKTRRLHARWNRSIPP